MTFPAPATWRSTGAPAIQAKKSLRWPHRHRPGELGAGGSGCASTWHTPTLASPMSSCCSTALARPALSIEAMVARTTGLMSSAATSSAPEESKCNSIQLLVSSLPPAEHIPSGNRWQVCSASSSSCWAVIGTSSALERLLGLAAGPAPGAAVGTAEGEGRLGSSNAVG